MPDKSAAPMALSKVDHGEFGAYLVVDDRPYLILGAELHNSAVSTSSAVKAAFEALEGRHINTVLATVSWAQVEPSEGVYDFALLDELLAAAREAGVRVIPLWFGAWKNGRSSYVPTWVKADPARFPRAEVSPGVPVEHVSPFGPGIRQKDAAAYAALLAHLREVDSDNTVVMVQVENEVGLLGASRDHSPLARASFDSQVPRGVFDALRKNPDLRLHEHWRERGQLTDGSWAEVFAPAPDVDEAFMAVAYAQHIEAVAAAGRQQHPLPAFTNAWLDSEIDIPGFAVAGGQTPGTYPSGGPLPHVAPLWREFAPSLDLLAPDIYFGDFDSICSSFSQASGGALFIPEMRRDDQGVGDIFVAVGTYHAMGVSPFGVDVFAPGEGLDLQDAYALLADTASIIHGRETAGFHLSEQRPDTRFSLGGYEFIASRHTDFVSFTTATRGYGLVVQLEPDVFVAIGRGFTLTIGSHTSGVPGILLAEELSGSYENAVVTRVLNGDETHSGGAIVHPARSSSHTSAPRGSARASTGMTRFRLYAFG